MVPAGIKVFALAASLNESLREKVRNNVSDLVEGENLLAVGKGSRNLDKVCLVENLVVVYQVELKV